MTHNVSVNESRVMSLLRTYGFAAVTTLLIWSLVGWHGGFRDFVQVFVLTILEITFSFDNAIVNSRLLKRLNTFWQWFFMTVGIIIAVFVVRFALPIFIVMLTAHLGFMEVIDLALHHPALYAEELHKANPLISAFGGTFLLMIGLAYFIDKEKDTHWIGWLEKRLAPFGRYDDVAIFVMLSIAVILYCTVPTSLQGIVLFAAVCGVLLHIGLDLFGKVVDNEDGDNDDNEDAKAPNDDNARKLAGFAALVMFIRLEVLDASFSFDGVVGAFAIATSVVIIMGGLGAGAMWVRAMTVHLLKAGTLAKYKFLEHGAMWAILFLGGTMIVKLYDIELPEWATGSIGVVFIALAVITSITSQRREQRRKEALETTPKSTVNV